MQTVVDIVAVGPRWRFAAARAAIAASLTAVCGSLVVLSAAQQPAPGAAGLPPVMSLVDTFTYGEWPTGHAPRLTIAQLRAVQRDLHDAAPVWIGRAARPEQPRRRLGVAVFLLDLLYTQNDPYLWTDNQPAVDLLDWGSTVFRTTAPTPAERLWYQAGMALLERETAANALDRLVLRAQERFPGDERWILARAIATDLSTWPEDRDKADFVVDPLVASQIEGRYEQAALSPGVRQEALVRLGFFALRTGHPDRALQRFAAVGIPQDVHVRYWLHLFQGRALERLNRTGEAIASYEQALTDVPFAASATAALVASFETAHRPEEAAALAQHAMTTAAPDDPWSVYSCPDWRFWPSLVEQLRAAVRQ